MRRAGGSADAKRHHHARRMREVAVPADLLAMAGHEEMAAHFAGPRAADSPALRVAQPGTAQAAADD